MRDVQPAGLVPGEAGQHGLPDDGNAEGATACLRRSGRLRWANGDVARLAVGAVGTQFERAFQGSFPRVNVNCASVETG